MVLYGITLVTLSEEFQAADLGLLTPFCVDDAAFDGSAQRSTHILKMILNRVKE